MPQGPMTRSPLLDALMRAATETKLSASVPSMRAPTDTERMRDQIAERLAAPSMGAAPRRPTIPLPQGMTDAVDAQLETLKRQPLMRMLGALNQTMGDPTDLNAMTVFHGSPHAFEKFDLSKIGTGEGAQAYGHGLYFADSPSVASSYKKAGIGDWSKDPQKLADAIYQVEQPFSDGRVIHGPWRSMLTKDELAARVAENPSAEWASLSPGLQKKAQAILEPPGQMYHVDLPDSAIAKMLDWDAPLSQQPEAVQKAVANIAPPEIKSGMKLAGGGELIVQPDLDFGSKYWLKMSNGSTFRLTESDVRNMIGTGMEGKAIYQALATKLGGDAAASAWMRERGIPGIKYFDGSSRAAGQGTRNYVVFDDTLPKILKTEK